MGRGVKQSKTHAWREWLPVFADIPFVLRGNLLREGAKQQVHVQELHLRERVNNNGATAVTLTGPTPPNDHNAMRQMASPV